MSENQRTMFRAHVIRNSRLNVLNRFQPRNLNNTSDDDDDEEEEEEDDDDEVEEGR